MEELLKGIRDFEDKRLYSGDVKATLDSTKSIDPFYRTLKVTSQSKFIFEVTSTNNLKRTDKAIYTFCRNREWLIREIGDPIILPYKFG